MSKLHRIQKTSQDSTSIEIITPSQLIARTYAGESVSVDGGRGPQVIERLGDGRYSVDGEGHHTLQGLKIWLGSYHAEFGKVIFWAA